MIGHSTGTPKMKSLKELEAQESRDQYIADGQSSYYGESLPAEKDFGTNDGIHGTNSTKSNVDEWADKAGW